MSGRDHIVVRCRDHVVMHCRDHIIVFSSDHMVVCCRDHMVAFMHKCHAVTEQIMSCFALGLGLKQDFFQEVESMHATTGLNG